LQSVIFVQELYFPQKYFFMYLVTKLILHRLSIIKVQRRHLMPLKKHFLCCLKM